MRLRAAASVLGVLLVAGGLWVSPVWWLALVFVGAALLAFGLMTEVSDGASVGRSSRR